MGTTYNDIRLPPRYIGEILVKIEIIAGKERIADTFYIENIGLCPLLRVGLVKLAPLPASEMLFIVFPYDFAISVKNKNRVSGILYGRINNSCKNEGITAPCGFCAKLKKDGAIRPCRNPDLLLSFRALR